MNKILFFSFFSVALTGTSLAQDTNSGLNPVEEDFTNLIEKSNDYQGYKVIDYNELITLKNKTGQYFSTLNEDIIAQKNTIDQQQDQINQLEKDLEATKLDLERVNADKDAITFLGMPFSKGGYMAFMWGIVAILVLALLFFIFRYKQSHAHTVEARNKLQSTEKEFDVFREKSLEKEQRLGRLLQDERNKASDK